MGRTRRRKKHTQPGAPPTSGGTDAPTPKTFVMERGKIGSTLSQLVHNIRQVMEPNTASKLKVRQRNVLKDFVQVAGPLGVTHFIIVSRTEQFINLRVCRLPRGPTLTFHINNFSLAKDVLSSQKDPISNHLNFLTPPLLVLNGFSSEDKPSQLMSTMFQNILPPISVQSVKLSDIRRCLLLRYNPTSNVVEFRHYAIRVKPGGMSRGVKRLTKPHVPDLSKFHDISEFVLGDNASDSEGEEMGGVGDVTLPQDLPGRGNIHSQQSAIKLSELGPRMSLQLLKIESGLCGGEVLYHSFVQRSRSEVRSLRHEKEGQRRLKATRKKEQDANVARKKAEKEHHKEMCLAGMKRQYGAGAESDESEADDDVEWYRQEVGEEPDPDTFMASGGKRKLKVGLKRRIEKQHTPRDKSAPKPKRGKLSGEEGDKKVPRRGTKKEHSTLASDIVRFARPKQGGLRTRGVVRGGKVGGAKRSGGKVFRKKAGRI